MEPDFLSFDEVAYELRIRSFPPVVTRHRLSNLRDRLIMESRNEVPKPQVSRSLDPKHEFDTCVSKLEELENNFRQLVETDSHKILNSLPSRFIHLLTRLERMDVVTYPSMKEGISKIDKRIRYHLDLLFKAREGTINLKEHLKFKSVGFTTTGNPPANKDLNVSVPLQKQTGAIPKSPRPRTHSLPITSDQNSVATPNNTQGSIQDCENISADDFSGLLGQINLNSDNNLTQENSHQAPQNSSLYQPNTNENMTTNPIQQPIGFNTNQAGFTPYIPNLPRNQNFRTAQNPYVPYYAPNYYPQLQNQDLYNFNYNQLQGPPQGGYAQQRGNNNQGLPQYVNPIYGNPYGVDAGRANPNQLDNFDFPEPPHYKNRYNILSWKLTFTGEGGISLHDFLIQIPLMARADRISENTLLASAIHLFGGAAREWYIAFQHSFVTWADLVTALREQFLPDDADYMLMKKIESRMQQRNERFVLYLSNILNMFSHLRNEISEIQKIAIVKRNMLPYLADRLALTNIQSLNQLSLLCRKIESIHSSRNIHDFEYPTQTVATKPRQNKFNNFELNENPNFDISVISNRPEARPHPQNEETRCWNCHNNGHDYTNCHLKRLRVFCFKCGEVGQASPSCLKCHPDSKNSERGAERQGVRLLSREH